MNFTWGALTTLPGLSQFKFPVPDLVVRQLLYFDDVVEVEVHEGRHEVPGQMDSSSSPISFQSFPPCSLHFREFLEGGRGGETIQQLDYLVTSECYTNSITEGINHVAKKQF